MHQSLVIVEGRSAVVARRWARQIVRCLLAMGCAYIAANVAYAVVVAAIIWRLQAVNLW